MFELDTLGIFPYEREDEKTFIERGNQFLLDALELKEKLKDMNSFALNEIDDLVKLLDEFNKDVFYLNQLTYHTVISFVKVKKQLEIASQYF